MITKLSIAFALAFAWLALPVQAETGLPEGCANGPERPYVCDIGSPRILSMNGFEEILEKNAAVRATVRRIGMPDRAEVQRVRVREPWSSWEVRTYYRSIDRMFVYGRAFILGSPQVTILRHESRIPQGLWAAWSGDPATRKAQGAAAEAAAAAEKSAEAAERTADLAEAMADDAAAEFPKSLMKP